MTNRTWITIHQEMAPSGEDETGQLLAQPCDILELMELGPVCLVRNIVRGVGVDYVTLAVVEQPAHELLSHAERRAAGEVGS